MSEEEEMSVLELLKEAEDVTTWEEYRTLVREATALLEKEADEPIVIEVGPCITTDCEMIPSWHCITHGKTYKFNADEFMEDTDNDP